MFQTLSPPSIRWFQTISNKYSQTSQPTPEPSLEVVWPAYNVSRPVTIVLTCSTSATLRDQVLLPGRCLRRLMLLSTVLSVGLRTFCVMLNKMKSAWNSTKHAEIWKLVPGIQLVRMLSIQWVSNLCFLHPEQLHSIVKYASSSSNLWGSIKF